MTRSDEAASVRRRRVPVQSRSRQRVAALLDAAEKVLVEEGAERFTTGRVCQVADVPPSALYQYFADRQAVLAALSERYLNLFVAASADLLVQARTEVWADVVRRLLDVYLDLYRALPGFRALWVAHFDASLARRYDEHLDVMAEGLLAVLQQQVPLPDLEQARSACRVAMRAGDALLRWAFATDPQGDPVTLRETERMLRLYLQDLLSRPGGFDVSAHA